MEEIDSTFFCYLLCGLIGTIKDNDPEEEMIKIGYLIGRTLIEKLEFKRELDLNALLYKITYNLLEKFYSSPRKLEASRDQPNVYHIIEYSPLYTGHVSNKNNFCGDSVTCGVIKYGLKASGFDCEVTGYPSPTEKYKESVVYEIIIK
jgi:hypothetical protein